MCGFVQRAELDASNVHWETPYCRHQKIIRKFAFWNTLRTCYGGVMENDPTKIKTVWNNQRVPVILRRDSWKLRVRLPFAVDKRPWLKASGGINPNWISNGKFWEVPKSWLNNLVQRALDRYNQLYVIQPYRAQRKCAPNCWNATGHDCDCQCMGENHGQGQMGSWLVISDTFATKWGDAELACRLMTKRK